MTFLRILNTHPQQKEITDQIHLGRFEELYYPEQIERPIDESISIEHILPQRPEEHWGLAQEEVKSYVHKIGNLVLVGQGFNSSKKL